MAYVEESTMPTAIRLHRVVSAPTNNDQRQLFGGQFVFAFTLADCVCFVCHASLAFSMASAMSYAASAISGMGIAASMSPCIALAAK